MEQKSIELGYSTMNRRLYLGALGKGPAWARVDDCGVCVAWDRRMAPVISREYREAEALLKAACPTIFDGFCLDITRKAQSLDHSTKFCELLRVHPMIHPDCEAKYFCDDILEKWTNYHHKRIEEISHHIGLKDALMDTFNGHLFNPDPKHTYLVFDFKVETPNFTTNYFYTCSMPISYLKNKQ